MLQPEQATTAKSKSINHEIKWIALKVTVFTLMIAISAYLIIDLVNFRQQLKSNMLTIAHVTADNSVGAIAFEDADLAETVLSSLDIFPATEFSGLYNKQRELLQYKSNGLEAKSKLPALELSQAYISDDFIEVIAPVMYQEETIGFLYLITNTNAQMERWKFQLISTLLILLLCTVVALYMSSRLPRSIVSAISKITDIFSIIAKSKDYSSRVSLTHIKEIDTLVSGFNAMLDELAIQDKQLSCSEERLTLALSASGEGLWDWHLVDKSVFYDKRVYEITGYNEDELGNKIHQWRKIIHPDDYAAVKADWVQHFKDNTRVLESEYRIRTKSGAWLWIRVLGKTVERDKNGKNIRVTGTIFDCTENHKSEEERALLTTVFKNSQESVVILDAKLTIRSANRAFTGLVGLSMEDILNQRLLSMFEDNHDQEFFTNMLNVVEQVGRWDGEIRFTNRENELVALWLEISPVNYDQIREAKTYIATFSNVQRRKKVEDELRYLANYDTLTGLPNRRLFSHRLDHALALSKRHSSTFALLFTDLDEFKKVNDTLGHNVGDKLLVEVSKRLRSCVRESDTVARMGGDEFVVLIEEVENKRTITAVADKIIRQMQDRFHIDDHDIKVTTSVGIAVYPNDGDDADTLSKNSDTAMYDAKKQGRDNYKFYNAEMNKQASERIKIESYLDKAITNEELFLVYQPKINLTTGNVIGAEVLIRWQHPILGLVSPVDFISIAEESGLIVPIGEWVIRTAFDSLIEWQQTPLENLTIAINVSGKQFETVSLPELMQKILSETSVPAEKVELELTESLLMETGPKAIETLKALKQLGLKLSIDDFGTGYSSLQYLSSFPVDYLKIDQSFVNELESNKKSETIVRAIVAMAKGLDLGIIAEGIEMPTQLSILSQLGCDMGQGYYFSKPLSKPDFIQYIHQQNSTLPQLNNAQGYPA